MAYVVAVRRQLACLVAVVGLNLPVASQFDRLIGPAGTPLAGEALRARLTADVNGASTSIMVSFVLLSHVPTEGLATAAVMRKSPWSAISSRAGPARDTAYRRVQRAHVDEKRRRPRARKCARR